MLSAFGHPAARGQRRRAARARAQGARAGGPELRERAGAHAHLTVDERGQPRARHRGGHRRPVREGARLEHLRGRSDLHVRRQRGRAQDADPVPDPLGGQRAGRPPGSAATPGSCATILFAILDTPISPELLPPDADGKIAQLTEAHLGPVRAARLLSVPLRPARAPAIAHPGAGRAGLCRALHREPTIKRWLTLFLRRFFANQFKRSCTPDGPKVGNVALSPRGDWRMPSDADVTRLAGRARCMSARPSGVHLNDRAAWGGGG